MARIRTIKPEMAEDSRLAMCSLPARWVFTMYLTHADDAGRFRASPSLVRSRLFPLDEDVTTAMVRGWMTELVVAGLIRLYIAEKEVLGEYPNFGKHQRIDRPHESRLSAFPGDGEIVGFELDDRGNPRKLTTDTHASGDPGAIVRRVLDERSTSDRRMIDERSTNNPRAIDDPSTEARGSLDPRACPRAPEEQGTGNREQGEEREACAARAYAREGDRPVELSAFRQAAGIDPGEMLDDWTVYIAAEYRKTHQGNDPTPSLVDSWRHRAVGLVRAGKPRSRVEQALTLAMAQGGGPGLIDHKVGDLEHAAVAVIPMARPSPENPIDRRIRETLEGTRG